MDDTLTKDVGTLDVETVVAWACKMYGPALPSDTFVSLMRLIGQPIDDSWMHLSWLLRLRRLPEGVLGRDDVGVLEFNGMKHVFEVLDRIQKRPDSPLVVHAKGLLDYLVSTEVPIDRQFTPYEYILLRLRVGPWSEKWFSEP